MSQEAIRPIFGNNEIIGYEIYADGHMEVVAREPGEALDDCAARAARARFTMLAAAINAFTANLRASRPCKPILVEDTGKDYNPRVGTRNLVRLVK